MHVDQRPAVLEWAFAKGDKVLFFPDQHLGPQHRRRPWATQLDDMRVWNPRHEFGGLTEADVQGRHVPALAGPLLDPPALPARAHRCLPGRTPRRHRDRATPSALGRPCAEADQVGSTDFIIRAVDAAPAGSTIAIGTEIHLVQRLGNESPDKTVVSLDPLVCPCSTMARIDPPHLAWVLENLVEGRVVNQITVDEQTAESARVALQRMLDIT